VGGMNALTEEHTYGRESRALTEWTAQNLAVNRGSVLTGN